MHSEPGRPSSEEGEELKQQPRAYWLIPGVLLMFYPVPKVRHPQAVPSRCGRRQREHTLGWSWDACCQSRQEERCVKRGRCKEPSVSAVQVYLEEGASCSCCSVAKSCPMLCSPVDCSPPGFSVHGISHTRIEWVAMPSSRGSSQPRDRTHLSCIGRQVL